ncbi:thiopurine S-methyltransferase [Thiomicrorhabdus sp. Kp2]|uniref:thiopurine S-methyltransferase n=1 Tax=Thiomicrorhabdus sp. Kp2 TaxID=1123518 RepID=UPI0004273825|nr:thiopurine S-methyltransferase [Thiomicrorhabdus sp. Kp2]
MEANFWHDMWASGVVGFQQPDVNGYLKNHWSKLKLNGSENVLVPLCGKSLDMIWLAQQGHSVLGIELSPKALAEFLAENKLNAEAIEQGNHCGYKMPDMTLLCGDFFHLTAEQCADIHVVYDRAALVALPPKMREQYVAHLQAILPKGSQFLLVTMEYDQNKMPGPPFSVSESEVMELFSPFASVNKVEEVAFSRKGINALEKVFIIQA